MAFEPQTLLALADPQSAGFDEVIDVRSPAEFATDRVPGAVNLPVLDNEERARVGTIYVQNSPFEARKLGAALVARNAARHIDSHFSGKGVRYRPLVYCWRGGQRSGALATILRQIGWRAEVLDGGYRRWRRMVKAALYDSPLPVPLVVLDGDTGSAKTELLALLAGRGVQVLDIEGLAQHRGSVFGAVAAQQPAQKWFESMLALGIARHDPLRPVVVEAESSRIGALRLPPSLWRAMCEAPRIRIAATPEARAEYLVRAYADLTADADALAGTIEKLRPFHPRDLIEDWLRMAATGRLDELAAGLIAHHYDPRYARARARQPVPDARVIPVERLAPDALDEIAARIEAALVDLPALRALD